MSRPASRVGRVVVTGPLAPFADAYRAELTQRGYTALTTVNELRQMARLSRWLEASGLTAADVSGERVEQFLAVQRAEGRRGACSLPGLTCLRDVLGGLGVLAVEELVRASSPDELLLASFERYLVDERGVGAATAAGYARHARCFLDGLSASGGLAGLAASEGARRHRAGSLEAPRELGAVKRAPRLGVREDEVVVGAAKRAQRYAEFGASRSVWGTPSS